ncbi:hypothetical protein GLAREA_11187 [Glarea lozoyensis ATCC 20868]|uniref:Tautomerase cis-CaaD-like domain-containing protein n=1 Tax=Glarea lozoyensis (strain ATCC 20868 / MF5171) TaxID=1116229 RepID=S3EAY4_GLAL2|nr:uncharacterized protein GLAREA_11187 [Glarea lozoyensis ATCC 20868]EPE35488.1 hypothetical protein GLAREA_11187 [Glarea lozoyensis ATCC 20868]
MPLLKFYTVTNQLTPEEKADLAQVLTARYAQIMPDFFVNIMFHELPAHDFYISERPNPGNFIRLTLEHIAVNWDEKNTQELERANKFLDFVGEVLGDRFEGRGWMYEYSILQTSRELWRVQGLTPPAIGSEDMKVWEKAGRGVKL